MTDSTKGNTIIDRVRIGIPEDNCELVFVKKNYDDATPYVIWKRYRGSIRPDDKPYTYNGHYFTDFFSAVRKWMEMAPEKPDFLDWQDENGNWHTDVDGSIA